ncbi:fungal-specific transcription factor domain-containing protein [Penicillium cinerascens]|uniref:Fungal-specific transcription factor domain-containing protein n=1 Tax=Penicillium cinerascens TaxID=70096 RepID=A0A9W9MLW0_9EURO|nr:fungal-specific transcription factor domain-containing protein [Penicillium cinerascens]KAJ5203753.1 fungal-specific transcription factor domain-containing protein [Penicillium cinerascens]
METRQKISVENHQLLETLKLIERRPRWTSKLSIGNTMDLDHGCLSALVLAYNGSVIFGAVFRPDFETRLRAHLQDPNQHDEDVAWYALRNAVYAVGCRTAGSMDGSRNFSEVQQESLRFFHNAFFVLSDLLFMPSGLMAVQALLAMTSFAELLGSPAVEYMLCASAARLAQSKGLHRHPSRLWKLPNLEILQRSWVFWAVYCYENYIALRSGRPSIFDDADISCEIPSSVPEGSTLDIDVFSAVIAHARICSEIIKNLCSVKALSQRPEALFQIMRNLEERLEEWRKLLPDHLTFEHHNDSAPSRYH